MFIIRNFEFVHDTLQMIDAQICVHVSEQTLLSSSSVYRKSICSRARTEKWDLLTRGFSVRGKAETKYHFFLNKIVRIHVLNNQLL